MANKKMTTAPESEQLVIQKGVPLKEILNDKSLRDGAAYVKDVYKAFDIDGFVSSTLDEQWAGLELKARMRQVTINLAKYLPAKYPQALAVLMEVTDNVPRGVFVLGMSFPDFVEVFGQDEKYWDLSIDALAKFTICWSAEFAVRPFIINHEKRMMAQMDKWSQDENEHLRRLSSEGCRPALPWAQSLPAFKNDPTPVLPILEQLKSDPSLYVRKSVANNINDISKNQPELVVKLAKSWYGKNKDTDWIVKHACRTLLKRGNRDALAIFGYHDTKAIDVSDFAVSTKHITMGDDLIFTFKIKAKKATKVRLEYGIDYVKANGKTSTKIFQISESSLKKDEQKEYHKKHSFADVSTRKHYAGTHAITLIVNGVERGNLNFEVGN